MSVAYLYNLHIHSVAVMHGVSKQSIIHGGLALNQLYTVMVSPAAVFVLFCVFGKASKLTHRVADFGQ